MPDFSLLATPAPYHIISYGALLGTEIFQSFIRGIVDFKALPRPQFASLQSSVFPIYFGMQTGLPVVLALTYPGERTAIGTGPSSLGGVLQESNRYGVLAPILIMFGTGLANLLVIGPATTKIMKERKHQETRDGKKSYDPAPHSAEMTRLNKAFGKMHGISSLVNLAAVIATLAYGFTLAERLH